MKKYLELYTYYKERILDGQLRSGDRLPSIREAAAIHGVSRTTVENAYFALQAEGFLLSSDRSGYYVSRKAGTKRAAPKPARDFTGKVKPRFDLSSGGGHRRIHPREAERHRRQGPDRHRRRRRHPARHPLHTAPEGQDRLLPRPEFPEGHLPLRELRV